MIIYNFNYELKSKPSYWIWRTLKKILVVYENNVYIVPDYLNMSIKLKICKIPTVAHFLKYWYKETVEF